MLGRLAGSAAYGVALSGLQSALLAWYVGVTQTVPPADYVSRGYGGAPNPFVELAILLAVAIVSMGGTVMCTAALRLKHFVLVAVAVVGCETAAAGWFWLEVRHGRGAWPALMLAVVAAALFALAGLLPGGRPQSHVAVRSRKSEVGRG